MRVHDEWLLTPERAAVHRPTATAVIADLHLGYELTRRASGEAVPLRGLEEVLAPLHALVTRRGARRLVIAGDLFERGSRASVLSEFLAGLRHLGLALDAIVPGNHDHDLLALDGQVRLAPEGVGLGSWWVHHGDRPRRAAAQVTGHLHPCLTWAEGQTTRCFLVGNRRIVLPAFSDDARGVNALRVRGWSRYRCAAIAGDRVLDFGQVASLAARLRHQSPQHTRA